MSHQQTRLNEEDLTSPSSDEKMDTGSESFRSQDTPNSTQSSDFDDQPEQVLRLQNPNNMEVLRLERNDNSNESMRVTKNRPKNLGISPPKFSSTLTLTTSHPLMGAGSPEDYPDLIPKKAYKEDDKDLSLSSIEDERLSETNGYFYSPQRNTSKNNLYFTENYVTADSQLLTDSLDMLPPDVARIEKRRIIIPKFSEPVTPQRISDRIGDVNRDDSAIVKYIEERTKILSSQSTPKGSVSAAVDITAPEEYHTGVAEWCESPSQLRLMPNFELPIEMSSSLGMHNDLDSPDVISSSTQEGRSAYEALLDPYTGNVALRPTAARSPGTPRRMIQLPPEDRCSLDSVSACSMESEPEPELMLHDQPTHPDQPAIDLSDDEDTKRSKSTNTVSECSDPIPEYSAAEELSNERGWLSVPRSGGGHNTCDMKVIEPYKRVLSHGGYDARGAALIVFSACHLPDCARTDYTYVMDNLFLYVIWTLERLVTDDYILVYLHGSAGRRRLPTFHWLHECYKLIDKRLRKSLKHLYLVHPTFWLKSFVILTKPFVSSKFFRKLSYIRSLAELMEKVPIEPNAIPEMVKQFDATRR